MKKSQFNVFIPLEDNNTLIYNTLTDSRVIVNKETEVILDRCRNTATLNTKQLNILKQLKELGIIVGSDVDEDKEVEYWFQKLKFDSTSINATILTTLSCNMDCIYCFQHGIESAKAMSQETSKKIFHWLSKKIVQSGAKELNLTFFGGEPLLNKEAIQYLSKNLFDTSRKNGTTLTIKLITNGLLLTEDFVDSLIPYGLQWIKVTLDGDETAHNRMRPAKDGSKTYSTILSNLLKIKGKVPIAIGGNYDDSSIKHIPLLMDDLRNKGFNGEIKEMAFKPILAYPGHEQIASYTHDACSFSDTNMEKFFWLVNETEKRGFKAFKKIELGPCEAIREHTYSFDPLGNIYKCAALAGRPEFSIGHIDKKEVNFTNTEFMTSDVWKKCKGCKFIPICNGGCRVSALLQKGSLNEVACEQSYFENVSKRLLAQEASC